MIGTCQVFPSDNPWNTDISNTTTYPDDPNSANYMNEMNPGGSINLHPDFGSNASYGIPINVVTIPSPGPGFVPITFTGYPSESDPGPYPIPAAGALRTEPSSISIRTRIARTAGLQPMRRAYRSLLA